MNDTRGDYMNNRRKKRNKRINFNGDNSYFYYNPTYIFPTEYFNS